MKHRSLLLLALLLFPVSALAQRADQSAVVSASALDNRIAAVVNDSVISTADINARMKLALLSSGLPATPDIMQRLFPQILRGLIDEQLQMQEAKRQDITVSKPDIDKAMERIAADNHIAGDMRDFVKAHGGSPAALEQQIRAGIAWSKTVQRELRPRVDVGDDEVDSVIERLRAHAGKDEFLVSEIFLTVDNPKDEDPIRAAAEKLVQQIKGGANFGAVARQFSQSTGAASGGDIGWIQDGQLPSELNTVLTSMSVGDVAGPVRSASGYHILAVRDKRTVSLGGNAKIISLDLQQVFRPFESDGDRKALLQDADKLHSTLTRCDGLKDRVAESFSAWRWQDLGTVPFDKIPAWLSDKVRSVSIGHSTAPLATDKGALIVFVCGQKTEGGTTDSIDRDAIFNSIGTEKLELQARRLMRDLRRTAYLDVRIGDGN